ncbi:MAG: hypothetical protein SW833_23625 [Cyanobacteriota bacterium]|nr:hypothetical protein [Cyanobacteriota bacterium]
MKTKGTTVWNHKTGWTSPELEVPAPGNISVFIDYPDDDLNMPIIEPDVEELLSSLGYVGEGRYLGKNDPLNPLDTKMITYVATFPVDKLSQQLDIWNQTQIPLEWFYVLDSKGAIAQVETAIAKRITV